ncbi:DUF2931 family protein [Chryseobacterium sp. BIGb0232]|uniref:DUF2931 family protein n=1 Tax=Chryseobacterium sp. BIGb0232 TaxID=2940598 RepID=UPI000F473333|nr:DUF2931 family protein [Chryseobacterium sp. BIGb0232]MCS4302476.1 hypothetical protein [Chryseobacterium sp. BIGb0232]
MNRIIKYLLSFLFFTQISCQEKKDHKKTVTMTKYEWTEGTSAPLGYPMEVYKGGIECEGGEWVGLDIGLSPGGNTWGTINNGMGNSFKGIPTRLDFTWMSYMENQFYMIDAQVDTGKIKEYFSKGYDSKASNGSGNIKHLNYNKIGIGMAPGGVVIVWVAGVGVQKEIGRYLGKKVTIPESEIAKLDSHEDRFFRDDYLKEIHTSEKIVPLKIQQENKGKSIPFGLWDSYRIQYDWKPVFELPEKGKLNPLADVGMTMINGEMDQLDSSKNPLGGNGTKAIPQSFSFSVVDGEDIRYGAGCKLNEKSAFEAFSKVFGKDPKSTKASLVIKINESYSFFTVLLKGENGKEAFIKTENLEMFKSRKK